MICTPCEGSDQPLFNQLRALTSTAKTKTLIELGWFAIWYNCLGVLRFISIWSLLNVSYLNPGLGMWAYLWRIGSIKTMSPENVIWCDKEGLRSTSLMCFLFRVLHGKKFPQVPQLGSKGLVQWYMSSAKAFPEPFLAAQITRLTPDSYGLFIDKT